MLRTAKRIVKGWRKAKDHTVVNPILDGKDTKSGHYCRVFQINGYPPLILTGYLDQLDELVASTGATLRKTIRYAPADIIWNNSMKYKLRRLDKNIKASTIEDPGRKAEQAAYDTILALRDSSMSGSPDARKLIDVWTFLTVSAPKKHQLEEATTKLKTWFDHVGGLLDDLRREQLEGLRQTSPLYDPNTKESEAFNKRHYGRVTTDDAAARTYPCTRGSFSDHKGLYFGRRSEDGGFCFINLCDPNDTRAQNITVFGKTGEGKSFFLKALVVSLLEEGIIVFVFDLTGEWEPLCQAVGGVYIDHSAENGRYFEPLAILPPLEENDESCVKYNKGRLYAAGMNGIRTLSLLADGMTKAETFEAGEAIKQVYKEAGIDWDVHDQSTWDGPYPEGKKPTIHRAVAIIQEKAKEGNVHAESLFDKVKIYFIGIFSGIFRHEEPLEFQRAPLIVYKVGEGTADGNEKDERAKQAQVKMSMAFDMVNANIQILKYEGVTFSAVLVDEGQRQMNNPEMRSAIFAWYTTIRQWNGMMILGANTPAIMLEDAKGIGCWENTNVRVYFFMETSAVNMLGKNADIPVEIQQLISQNEGTRKYVLEYHKQYDELFMEVPDEEARLYKTRGLKEAG